MRGWGMYIKRKTCIFWCFKSLNEEEGERNLPAANQSDDAFAEARSYSNPSKQTTIKGKERRKTRGTEK